MLRVLVITSDNYLWAVQPFAYLFNLHWSSLQTVIVAGYSKPGFPLPSNFNFISIDKENYPPEKWSDGIIHVLRLLDDEWFVLMLEDYWLTRTVDTRGIASLHDYLSNKPNVLRMDLTADRLYAGNMRDLESWGHYDIVTTPHGSEYQMSTQAGIWNRKNLLSLLVPGKSAWEVELHTQPPEEMTVLGTRQYPVRYANAILKGKLDDTQLKQLPAEHHQKIFNMIPPHWLNKGMGDE